jgi:hypothetical protein
MFILYIETLGILGQDLGIFGEFSMEVVFIIFEPLVQRVSKFLINFLIENFINSNFKTFMGNKGMLLILLQSSQRVGLYEGQFP